MEKTLWLLLDNRRGSVGQAMGIARALGQRMNIVEKHLVYNTFSVLPNFLKGRTLLGIDRSKSDTLEAPFPDVVLSTSRRTVSAARYIRKASGFKTKIVHLMYPSGGGIQDMDMIIVPKHDDEKKHQNKKTFLITGAPTRIFADTVAEAKQKWDPIFANLPKPWISVIIGGAIKGKPWPLENAKVFADRLKEIHQQLGGSFLLTTSRRTGKEAEDIILSSLKDVPMYTYLWGEKKENPIMGFYACPDIITVTADSVSMCSEACGTGIPVLLYQNKNWLPKKHQRFAASLIDQGYAADILSKDSLSFRPQKTLNPATDIAEKILELCQR